jgi:putative ABC transport system substrate-binding protein
VISRRLFLSSGVAIVAQVSAMANAASVALRLGMLLPSAAPTADDSTAAMLIPAGLVALGYREGQTLFVERRFAERRLERLPALAADLISSKVDVVVAVGASATQAAIRAGKVPVVFYGNIDPVRAGLVTSLARPGGNLTGVLIAPEGTLGAKKLELLREVAPRGRVAVLAPDDPGFAIQRREIEQAAAAQNVSLFVVEAVDGDYVMAFEKVVAGEARALVVGAHTYFVRDRRQIIALASRHRLPAIWEWREQVVDGGLMAYGASLTETTRKVAVVVDRIFRGAKAGDIPIEQPASLRLVVNRASARAIGLDLPRSLVLRADEVIE